MNLHHDREAFEELIIGAANELMIPTNIVEKDYYVTMVLKSLAGKVEDMVFKGGTSLTKCYQLLERFSEDIDISYTAESGTPGEARKKQLEKAAAGKKQSSFLLLRQWKNFNFLLQILKKQEPFLITTQTIERTLIDKVFAICDYYMRGELERHSRHLYDIYKIVNLIGITEEMRGLIPKVRKVRSELEICPSAKDNVDVTGILNEIIEKQVYKKDYEEITFGLLFVPETYDTVITGVKQLADSKIWN